MQDKNVAEPVQKEDQTIDEQLMRNAQALQKDTSITGSQPKKNKGKARETITSPTREASMEASSNKQAQKRPIKDTLAELNNRPTPSDRGDYDPSDQNSKSSSRVWYWRHEVPEWLAPIDQDPSIPSTIDQALAQSRQTVQDRFEPNLDSLR